MTAKVLTDRTLRALKPAPAGKRVLVWDRLVPGMAVRTTDRGTRTFVLVRRYPGSKNPTPRAIGEYGAISLEQARAKARSWLELLQRGIDPTVQEQRERDAELSRRADSVASVFELFVKHHLSTLRSSRSVEALMRRNVVARWGRRPLTEITRKDVIALVYEISDGGAPIAANRTLAWVKTFFAWAVERGRLDSSVAALVKRPSKERARDRVLADHELRAVWRACGHLGSYGQAVRFLMATGQRRGEVGGAVWSEIDRDAAMWRLPAARTKANRSHELPLCDLALGCLGSPKHGFIFSIRSWSQGKARLDRLVISRLLNHADGGVTARYDRHGRDSEKVEAMAAWGRRLAQIVDPQQPAADVVPLRRRP